MSRARWLLTVLAGLALIAAFGVRPFARSLGPRLAVAMTVASPGRLYPSGLPTKAVTDGTDPWQHALIARIDPDDSTHRAKEIYSRGPDGVDDDGRGDDIVPTALERELGRRLLVAPIGLSALFVLIVWCAHGPHGRTPRSESLAMECYRAAGLATVPTFMAPFVGAALILGSFPDPSELARFLPFRFVDPVLGGLAGSGVACFAVALAWRLTRPLEVAGS